MLESSRVLQIIYASNNSTFPFPLLVVVPRFEGSIVLHEGGRVLESTRVHERSRVHGGGRVLESSKVLESSIVYEEVQYTTVQETT